MALDPEGVFRSGIDAVTQLVQQIKGKLRQFFFFYVFPDV
jgi:hypothetical protein